MSNLGQNPKSHEAHDTPSQEDSLDITPPPAAEGHSRARRIGNIAGAAIGAATLGFSIATIVRSPDTPHGTPPYEPYKIAVDKAEALARQTTADDLYDCMPQGYRVVKNKQGDPVVLVNIDVELTDLAKSGYFSDRGIDVDGSKVEIGWIQRWMTGAVKTTPDGQQIAVPGSPQLRRLKTGQDHESSAYTEWVAVPIGNPSSQKPDVPQDRETTVMLSVKYINVGNKLVAGKGGIPETAAACAKVQYHIAEDGTRTAIGVTDKDGKPLKTK